MFGQRRVRQGLLNVDERDTTEVPKQALNVILDYLFIFYHGVRVAFSGLELGLYQIFYSYSIRAE